MHTPDAASGQPAAAPAVPARFLSQHASKTADVSNEFSAIVRVRLQNECGTECRRDSKWSYRGRPVDLALGDTRHKACMPGVKRWFG